MEKSNAALAWGGVLLAGVLWGGGALVAQQLMAGGMSPESLALARFALGLPLLWGWAWHAARRAPTGRDRMLWPWRLRTLVLGTGAAMALSVGCWFQAISLMGAALPTVISVCCAPVFVALIATLRGYERMDARLLIGLALALLGTALLVAPQAGGHRPMGPWAGVAWSLGAAVMHALVVLGNARMPRTVSPLAASAWGMSAAALCAAAVALAQGLTWPQGGWQWLGAGYTGVVTTALAYVAFAWGARRLGPTASVVGTLVEPLVAALLAAWLLGEAMGATQVAGALVLCMAIMGLSRRR